MVTLFYMALDCILYKLFNGHFVLHGPGLYSLWVVHWSLCSTGPWTVSCISCSLITLFYNALGCILYELFTSHFVLQGPGLYPVWVVHWSAAILHQQYLPASESNHQGPCALAQDHVSHLQGLPAGTAHQELSSPPRMATSSRTPLCCLRGDR